MIDRPTARYGGQRIDRRTGRRIAIGLTALVAILGVAIAAVAFSRFGSSEVKGEMAGYEIVDPHTVDVTISVTRDDPSRSVVCIVRARSKDGEETGRREVLVPPSQDTTVQVTTPVTSSRPVAIGDVYGCGTEVPGYLIAQ
ncbi:hypothetical protein FHR72_004723 [Mycolicibacterium iranicum]|uniref:DUF4307 domain-containing protein n=1 Tax=Mycolicibacterium iranicum TaxID=912594 RepID=A0A839QGH5_MYCIR|nr:DUF4307 domain-containing protein [Mycolicibacterium iranicum]MBB2993216.1 hypothetical protein [Mycolicibacterium iranicum]